MTEISVPGTDAPLDEATGVFVDHRELLFGVVYNMLGSVADTEDVLQETWLSWTARGGGAPLAGVDNPRAYLVRVAVNHALRRRAVISRRRVRRACCRAPAVTRSRRLRLRREVSGATTTARGARRPRSCGA